MKVHTEIDDRDLDDQFPDDEEDEAPNGSVMVIVRTADGMGHSGAVYLHESLLTPERLAEAAVSALHGAARTHGPALAAAVERWLVVPPDLEIVPGGEGP